MTSSQEEGNMHTRLTIVRLKTELKEAEERLAHLERSCTHSWGETKSDHVYHKGYSYEPSGRGSDWRPGGHVSAETEKRWKRECKLCGKIEYTKNIEKQVTEKPRW